MSPPTQPAPLAGAGVFRCDVCDILFLSVQDAIDHECPPEHQFDLHTDECSVCHMPRMVAQSMRRLARCPGAPR